MQNTLSPQLDLLAEGVARYFNIPKEDMLFMPRKSRYTYPRQIYTYLVTMESGMALRDIAATLGKRDHRLVYYARERIKGFLKVKDDQAVYDVGLIRDIIQQLKNQNSD
jgi:chromosomal replication initiation ATPase DnaA